MIKFKSLSLRNFLSYGNVPTIVILDRPGTTLVVGEDLDNTSSGTGANGVGKTVLLNALAYSIYDKPISSISKDNLVNNINKKNMEVTIEFEKDGVDYKIHRSRKMKAGAAGNHVYFYENGKDITPDSMSNTNEMIENIVGIPHDLFARIVAFSATHVPFLDLPVRSHYAANQTDIIEELFDLKTLSAKALLLKEEVKSTELTLETHTMRSSQIKKEHERHSIQLISAEKRVNKWILTNKEEIDEIEAKLYKIKNVDFDEEQKLHNALDEVGIELKESALIIQNLEKSIKSKAKLIKKATTELEHLRDAECPYCLQQFEDTDAKIKENEEVIKITTAEAVGYEDELTKADNNAEAIAEKHRTIKDKITINDMDNLLEIKNKSDRYENRLVELKGANNPFIEPLEELQNVELDVIDNDQENKLRTKIDHQKFLLKLLTKKDSFVRKALLNKNIPYLNSRLQHYLQELGLPHTVEFTHEMTASISQFGRLMDFGNLSNGQRARVNIALSFSFRDVLQNMHEHMNVCMLDEVLDVGLDAIGVQAAARMLKRKAREENISMYIISHRDEVGSAFDNRMTVQMAKGFSYLKFQD